MSVVRRILTHRPGKESNGFVLSVIVLGVTETTNKTETFFAEKNPSRHFVVSELTTTA